MMDGYTARLEMKARHLIIDLGSPMDSESLLILTQLKTKDDIVCSLKKWLFNKKYNREQLRLLLPDDAVLCDLKENMLRPSLLTFSHKFYIQKDTSCGNISQKKVKIQCESKVYELQVTLRVLSSGLCESLIFGEALNVVPTAFCQGAYEDALLINKQKFYSLCISLLNKEEYLIAKLTDEPPTGYFVLMPSPDSLLIKPIVCQDLWLPDDKSRELTPPQGVLIEKMEQSLALVDIVQEYKVGLNSSGLYTALLKFHESKIKRSKKNEDEDDDGVEGTSSWVTISHPALEDKHPLKKSKRKCRRPDPLKCIEYIKK